MTQKKIVLNFVFFAFACMLIVGLWKAGILRQERDLRSKIGTYVQLLNSIWGKIEKDEASFSLDLQNERACSEKVENLERSVAFFTNLTNMKEIEVEKLEDKLKWIENTNRINDNCCEFRESVSSKEISRLEKIIAANEEEIKLLREKVNSKENYAEVKKGKH